VAKTAPPPYDLNRVGWGIVNSALPLTPPNPLPHLTDCQLMGMPEKRLDWLGIRKISTGKVTEFSLKY